MKKKALSYYLIAPAVVAAVFFVMLAVRHIYPFGEDSIFACDLGLGEMSGVGRFCGLFSGGSFFYNWKCAFGFPSDCLPSVLDPFYYFYLFFPASRFRDVTTYCILLKFLFIALSSSLFFKKAFPRLSAPWAVYMSVLYTFSGYALQYYSNMSWLNTVGLFPLIVLSGLYMLRGSRKAFVSYAGLLFYLLVQNNYMAFFVVVILLLEGGLWIFFMVPREERKKAAFRIAAATGFPLAASSGFLYSAFFGITSSARFQDSADSGTLSGILYSNNDSLYGKLLMFCGLEFVLLCFFFLMRKYREEKRAVLFFLFSAALFVIPVFVQGTDLLWHMGSYNGYPMRYGFVLPFVLLCAAAWYLERYKRGDRTERRRYLVILKPTAAAVVGIFAYALLDSAAYNMDSNVVEFGLKSAKELYTNVFAAAFLVTLLCFFIISLIRNKKARYVMNAALLVLTAWFSVSGLLGATGRVGLNSSVRYIERAQAISSFLSAGSVFDRVSNPDLTLTDNYAYFTGRTSVCGWTHSVSEDTRSAIRNLGFSTNYTLIHDSGATAFTRALSGITEAVSRTALDKDFYTLKAAVGNDYQVYACKYTLPFGMVFDGSLAGVKYDKNAFEYQNDIYTALSGDTGLLTAVIPVSERYTSSEKTENGKTSITYTQVVETKADKDGALYFYLNDEGNDYYIDKYSVEDLTVTIADESGKVVVQTEPYRTASSNNIVELCSMKAEERVKITISAGTDFKDDILLYALDMDKLQRLCDTAQGAAYTVVGDTVTADVTAKKGQILFVPTQNASGWRCTVNGEQGEIVTVLGAFIGIRLTEGQNHVVLTYTPVGFWLSTAVAVFFIAAAAGYLLLIRRKDLSKNRFLTRVSAMAYIALWSGGIVILYIVPIAFLIFKLLKALPFF